jgi:hypothetical protein
LLFAILGGVWLFVRRRSAHLRWPGAFPEGVSEVIFDPEFLLKVIIQGMPPAFVKQYGEGSHGEHILQSQALVAVQQDPAYAPISGLRRRKIVRDHRQGDKLAMGQGTCHQLELADTLLEDRERVILTTKAPIEHRGRRYVVGWYVPVDDLHTVPSESHILLEEDAHQVKFRLAKSRQRGGIRVRLGDALRSRP